MARYARWKILTLHTHFWSRDYVQRARNFITKVKIRALTWESQNYKQTQDRGGIKYRQVTCKCAGEKMKQKILK